MSTVTSEKRCPTCGAELQRFTSRLHCPACNTDVTLAPNQNDELREDITFAASVLAELYAKYSAKIGPFASQAQAANGRLRSALKRLTSETSECRGVDSRDVLIAALTKWADDWSVVRQHDVDMDKGWRFAAEEVKAIIAKSDNTPKVSECLITKHGYCRTHGVMLPAGDSSRVCRVAQKAGDPQS
jgi:uncharacterized Zn finger protein (UPF0148 family)